MQPRREVLKQMTLGSPLVLAGARAAGRYARTWLLLLLVFNVACASDAGDQGNGQAASGSGGSPSAGQSGAAAGGSATGGGNAGSTAVGGTNAGTSNTAGSSGSPAGNGGATCREGVPAAEWDANCLVCAGNDPCSTCACANCAQALRDCEATAGCQEIAECVKAASCLGVDCYCGSDTAVACANGGGNGPCKEAILSAPGGKPPTLADPSGGPASDAVGQLALCLQGSSTCGSVCN